MDRSFSSTSSVSTLPSISSSSSSLNPFSDSDAEIVTEDDLQHADRTLSARNYKSAFFLTALLDVIKTLAVPSWLDPRITADNVKIHKVSGSLTNAVFFVSSSVPDVKTLLLRIYGSSSGSLISRPRELHILHILSSQYRIGPRIYGTFKNGRIEEYFDSRPLTHEDLRDPTISRWIGARMAELHSVDIEAIENTTPDTRGEGVGWEIAGKKNIKSWLGPAQDVLGLEALPEIARAELDLTRFKSHWDSYLHWLSTVDNVKRGSRRVFAHNDAQYGNLLMLSNPNPSLDEHRQIIVVDFEYASPNPASFDIANHFHEWTANYHGDTPYLLKSALYPTREERRNFLLAYLEHADSELHPSDRESQVKDLDDQVRFWSPASHAMWAVWGIVQAREDVEGLVDEPEFDYIAYARCRMNGFYRELRSLGVV